MTNLESRYVGMDIHKRQAEVCILGEDGQRVRRLGVAVTRPSLLAFAKKCLKPTDEVALEATTNTWAVVDILKPHVAKVVVSNPLQTKAIATSKIKTDKIDARVLAELLRCRFLPEVWQPDLQTRRQRTLTHRRSALVRDRTRIKNRMHSTLAERLVVVPMSELFSAKGLEWLAEVSLDEDGRLQLDSDLRLLAALETEIEAMETKLAQLAYPQPEALLLMTLPGVNVTVALGLLAAWGNINRFPDGEHASSYLGLVPSTRQSAQSCYHGSITKRGNSHARWLLIQAAQHWDKHPGPHGVFFRRLEKKKGRNVAVVATARKIATIAYLMLKNNEPYRYALPASTNTKLASLRVRATGEKRKRGPAKGAPRSKAYGTGKRRRKIPGLAQVYESEGLPPVTAPHRLSEGERRTLKRTKTLGQVREIHQTQYRTRKTVKKEELQKANS